MSFSVETSLNHNDDASYFTAEQLSKIFDINSGNWIELNNQNIWIEFRRLDNGEYQFRNPSSKRNLMNQSRNNQLGYARTELTGIKRSKQVPYWCFDHKIVASYVFNDSSILINRKLPDSHEIRFADNDNTNMNPSNFRYKLSNVPKCLPIRLNPSNRLMFMVADFESDSLFLYNQDITDRLSLPLNVYNKNVCTNKNKPIRTNQKFVSINNSKLDQITIFRTLLMEQFQLRKLYSRYLSQYESDPLTIPRNQVHEMYSYLTHVDEIVSLLSFYNEQFNKVYESFYDIYYNGYTVEQDPITGTFFRLKINSV